MHMCMTNLTPKTSSPDNLSVGIVNDVHVHNHTVQVLYIVCGYKTTIHLYSTKLRKCSCQHISNGHVCKLHTHLSYCVADDPDKKSPSSPFDIRKFDFFATRSSPVTTPPADANKVNMYSRHSREESQNEVQLQQTSKTSPRSISPILAQGAGSPHGSGREEMKPVEDQADVESQSESDSAVNHSSSVSMKEGGTEKEKGEEGEVSPRTSAKLKLDELVSEHANLIQPVSSKEDNDAVDEKVIITVVPSSEDDRALELENLVNTDESTSEPQSSSTVSLLEDDDDSKRYVHVYGYETAIYG